MSVVQLPPGKHHSVADLPLLQPHGERALRMTNAKLCAENDRLSRVLETQLTNVDALMISNNNVREQCRRLTEELNRIKHSHLQLEGVQQTLRNRAENLEKRYRSLHAHHRKLETDYQCGLNRVDFLQSQLDNRKHKLIATLEKNRELVATIDNLREHLLALQTSVGNPGGHPRPGVFRFSQMRWLAAVTAGLERLIEQARVATRQMAARVAHQRKQRRIIQAHRKRQQMWAERPVLPQPLRAGSKNTVEDYFVQR